MRPLSKKARPIWQHSSFIAEFCDPFLDGTGMDSGDALTSFNFVVHALKRQLDVIATCARYNQSPALVDGASAQKGLAVGNISAAATGGEFLEAYGVDFSQITGKLKKIHRDFSHPTNTKLFKKVHGLVDLRLWLP